MIRAGDLQGHEVMGLVAFLHHLESARQKVQDPVAQNRVQTQGPKLCDELGGYYGVKN
jgi:hypothetical protein